MREQSTMRSIHQAFQRAIVASVVPALLAGGLACNQSPATSEPAVQVQKPVVAEASASGIDDALRAELDEVLEFTYRTRSLNLKEHAAWQILHGVLAYQQEFLVVNEDGQEVPVVEHLLSGGQMKGWTVEPGVWLDKEQTRRGLRAVLEQGSKTGQGHSDQWLAILAQCGLPPTQKIELRGQEYTLQEMIEQVLWDVPRNMEREYSWTLIGLTTYLPTDYRWTASDEKEWSIEKLVGIEAEQDINTSACGGSHRLIGMAMALNRHLSQGGKIEGVWKQADERIQQAIQTARQYQNEDGSFSPNYFSRGGRTPDLGQNLGATGHTLEFLTLALNDEQLREPWVQRAAVNMCDLFRKTRKYPLECGALYHAAHGLVLYRQRLFGERTYGRPPSETAAASEEPVARQNTPATEALDR